MTRKIMVVDDDKDFLEELRETLELSGYSVDAVSDAHRAFELAHQNSPDLIILDLRMKGMTGFEVATKLRNFQKTMAIPIIAMTGFFTESEDETLLNFFNIHNLLKKPFNPLDAISQIETVLRDRRKNHAHA